MTPPPLLAAPAPLPLAVSVDVQDHLLTTTSELARLLALLDDSHESLQRGFFGALAALQEHADAGRVDAGALASVRAQLESAVRALQFQDMATQLIGHTSRRLQHCADRLACDVFADDGEDDEPVIGEAPQRPNPVSQSVMQAGSIDLF
ncbi:MAG: hypothetical protein KA151_01515 [Piscinibacter sp.]|nr:hypothetical protein [Piscinibacter sp.]